MNVAAQAAPAVDAAVAKWLAALADAQTAEAAVDDLLLGRVWLGRYAGGETAVVLPQFLPVGQHESFDGALQSWLAAQVKSGAPPADVTAKAYAQALVDAFALLQVLDLPCTKEWCVKSVDSLWLWLKRWAVSVSRDPRPVFLRALALAQKDRSLLPFWAHLCHQADERFAPLALFALRRMPKNDQGEKEDVIPLALVTNLLAYGKTLARSEDTHRKRWLEEVDFLSAVYPAPKNVWEKQFRLARANEAPPTLRNWLDTRFSAATRQHQGNSRHQPLQAPYWDIQVRPLLDALEQAPEQSKLALQGLMEQHRYYARETGDAYFLVRAFCRLGDHLLKPGKVGRQPRDPAWALDLAEEAVHWAPTDPRTWALFAKALDVLGDWRRARAVYWYARRRFPHDAFSHSQLGHALAMRGEVETGEAVYRQAILRFPKNPVCWNDLAHTLRVAGRGEDAVAVYREAKELFHHDPVWACGYAGVLIDLGDVAAAEEAVDWAAEVSGAEPRQQQVLADLRQRLAALERGAPKPEKSTRPTPEITSSSEGFFYRNGVDLSEQPHWGLLTLWRQHGDYASARQILEAFVGDDPLRRVEEGLLRRCEAGDGGWSLIVDDFKDLAQRHRGDATVQAHYQRARLRCGEEADWRDLYRYPAFSPFIRLEKGQTDLPPELQHPELDDDGMLARWLLETGDGASLSLRDAVEDDYIASQRMAA